MNVAASFENQNSIEFHGSCYTKYVGWRHSAGRHCAATAFSGFFLSLIEPDTYVLSAHLHFLLSISCFYQLM